jgi:hypothetical protein
VDDKTVAIVSRRHGRRTFRQVGSRPHRRVDGTETTLMVWEGACVKCGTAFEVTTPTPKKGPLPKPDSHAFFVTTCRAHRRASAAARLLQTNNGEGKKQEAGR